MQTLSPDATLPCATYADDEPTDRFELCPCPACGTMTPVPLSTAMATCETCDEEVELPPG